MAHPRQLLARLAALAGLVAMGVGLAGCRRSAGAQPGDPMLDAIRAEERAAGFTYAEGQGRQLFRQYCATCHGDVGAMKETVKAKSLQMSCCLECHRNPERFTQPGGYAFQKKTDCSICHE